MKKFILPLAIPVLFPAAASAEALNVCDFENYEIGQELTLWNRYGAETTSTAKVVADPSNPLNKVLFVDLKDWNDYVELQLPEEFAGKNLTDNFTNIKFACISLKGYMCTSPSNWLQSGCVLPFSVPRYMRSPPEYIFNVPDPMMFDVQ